MKLGECRGIVEAINDACTCGGNGPVEGCPACEVYHAIRNMEMATPEEVRAACERAWQQGWNSFLQSDLKLPNPHRKAGT
ncbi:MAG: hypothetical protein QG571_1291 [Pseudomonadota bacterium]|nr:hypothetical protein [Pseudomonadota bacterium]